MSTRAFCFLRDPRCASLATLKGLLRDLAQEAEVCFKLGVPYFITPLPVFDHFESPENYVFWREIWDEQSRPAFRRERVTSLRGYTVLLRASLGATAPVLQAVQDLGGEIELDSEDVVTANSWPLHVKREFMKRSTELLRRDQLMPRLGEFVLKDRVFVKTAQKMTSQRGVVVTANEAEESLSSGTLPFLGQAAAYGRIGHTPIDAETPLIVSQPVELLEDAYGTLEYRAWVLDNRPAVITRWSRPSDFPAPCEVRDFTVNFATEHAATLPPHYVVDIGIARDLGPLVVEVNDFMSSGNTSTEMFREIAGRFHQPG